MLFIIPDFLTPNIHYSFSFKHYSLLTLHPRPEAVAVQIEFITSLSHGIPLTLFIRRHPKLSIQEFNHQYVWSHIA